MTVAVLCPAKFCIALCWIVCCCIFQSGYWCCCCCCGCWMFLGACWTWFWWFWCIQFPCTPCCMPLGLTIGFGCCWPVMQLEPYISCLSFFLIVVEIRADFDCIWGGGACGGLDTFIWPIPCQEILTLAGAGLQCPTGEGSGVGKPPGDMWGEGWPAGDGYGDGAIWALGEKCSRFFGGDWDNEGWLPSGLVKLLLSLLHAIERQSVASNSASS